MSGCETVTSGLAQARHGATIKLTQPCWSMLLASVVVAACWAAAGHALKRWLEPWGSPTSAYVFVFTFAFWCVLVFASPRVHMSRLSPARSWLIAAALVIGLYAVLYPHVPQLVTCELAVAALACVMLGVLSDEQRDQYWGIAPLLLLSMHVSTSVEFFVGFPLRFVSTKLAALMLGSTVDSTGVVLSRGTTIVGVDDPCSGVNMLTSALVLAGSLSLLLRLRPVRTFLLMAIAAGLAVFGNAHRASTLFLFFPGSVGSEVEVIIGIIVFVECVLVLAIIAFWFRRRQKSEGQAKASTAISAGQYTYLLFAITCTAAAMSPLTVPEKRIATAEQRHVVSWPTTWGGEQLWTIPLTKAETNYLRDFPGDWRQFKFPSTDIVVLLRWCVLPTRTLHAAENCFLAQGGACEHLSSIRDQAGHVWSRFRYKPLHGVSRDVRQCYFAVNSASRGGELDDWIRDARSWPDASAWYWAAAMPGSDVRMTLAITVTE